MTVIIGNNKPLDINGNISFSIEQSLKKYYNKEEMQVIFNLQQSEKVANEFTNLSKQFKKTFSHLAIIKINEKTLILADSYINISPDLKTLYSIITNTINGARKYGINVPKVAVLSAVEVVSLGMESATPASVMEAMGKRKQFGKEVFVEGPLSIDVSLSEKSAKEKKVDTQVAGKANILIGHKSTVPNGIVTALKLFANTDFLISAITDGQNFFPYILNIMNENDIKKTIEFCN
jgi:hypothetical protein